MIDAGTLREKFRHLFGGEARVFRAPGRVNLIGGHLDYNQGWVLPLAVDRACWVAAQARGDGRLRVHSVQFGETVESGLEDQRRQEHHWSDYVRGVAWALRQEGMNLRGADLLVSSDVPLGSGLSSSAALEVATSLALLGVSQETMEPERMALACQRAENEYVGMRCGIMDQLAACFGRAGHVLLIDCRTLDIEPIPLDEAKVRVVVANTGVKHALAASEYNTRRQECEEAVERLRPHKPGVKALRDVSWEEAEGWVESWPDNLRRRVRHVTTEMGRVHRAVEALRRGDYAAAGRLMEESHASLDQDYQVTSPELNAMVAQARTLAGYYGARMTGGGFGGCTVNLVRAGDAEAFATALAGAYEQATGLRPQVYLCRASAGGGEVQE